MIDGEGFDKKIGKILNLRLSYKAVNILLITGFCLLLIPMAVIAFYDVPSSDDFGHCIWTYPVYTQTGSVLQTILTAFKWVGSCYYNISGTFTVQVLDALAPNVFGLSFYRITFYIMIVSLCSGLLYFYKTLLFDYFKIDRIYVSIISLVTLIIFTQCLPSAVEGFYWYVGAITYTFYFAVFLVMCSLIIKLFTDRIELFGKCVLPVLTFILGGGNHITALLTGVVILCVLIYSLLLRKNALKFIPALITWGIAFILNVVSPGNEVRKQATGGGAGFIKSFVLAFRAIILSIDDWTSLPFLAFVLVTIPVLWVAVGKVKFNFRYPFVVSFLSFCFLAAMYYPPIYGMNSTGQGRLKNIVFFAYTILLILNIFYWFGWLKLKIGNGYFKNCSNGLSVIYAAVLVLCVGFGTLATVQTPVTSYSAAMSLINGEAQDYYQTELERVEILENSDDEVVLPAFKSKPYVIYFGDINDGEGLDEAMEDYYQKKSIVVE